MDALRRRSEERAWPPGRPGARRDHVATAAAATVNAVTASPVPLRNLLIGTPVTAATVPIVGA